MNEESIYEKAFKKWGFDFQLDMVVEECAELILAIQKAQRKTYPHSFQARTEKIVEEAVDVGLMLEQLKVMMPIPRLWEETKARKIRHLEELLEIEEAKP